MQGRCTASKIAELLYISKPAVSSKINELIKQGFVVKKQDKDDSRKNILYVNEDMMPKYKIYKDQDSLAIKRISEKYTKKEIENFCEMLEIISNINFEEIN